MDAARLPNKAEGQKEISCSLTSGLFLEKYFSPGFNDLLLRSCGMSYH